MTERTTRIVCRTAFVVGCVAPTLLLGAICLWHAMPFAARSMEQQLTATLGMHVSVGELQYPRANRLRLLDVRLNDPESGDIVAKVDRLDAAQVGAELVVWLRGVEVTQSGSSSLEELVLRRVRQRLAPNSPVVRMVVSDLTIESSEQPLTFTQASLNFEPLPRGAQARLRLNTNSDESHPIELNIFRRLPDDGLVIQWNNQHTPLPCALIASLLPAEIPAGEAATFAGSVTLEQTAKRWTAALTGQFDQLDWSQLGQFAGEPTIAAHGSLDVEQAIVHDGRLVSATATFSASDGEIDATRLAEIADALQLKADFLTKAPATRRLAFDRLAIRLRIDERGVRLDGQCDDNGQQMITDDWGPLLLNPRPEPRPIAQLIDALVDRRPTTFATADADWFARRLPRQRPPMIETANRLENRFE